MNRRILLAVPLLIAGFATGNALLAQTATGNPFSDVPNSNAHADAIAYVQTHGIVSGYNDGTYKPDATVNRAEFTKIIVSAVYDEQTIKSCDTSTLHFNDIDVHAWYAPYLCVAVQKNVIGGYPDGSFRPADNINLAEASKIIVLAFGYDSTPSDQTLWYSGYIDALTSRHAVPDDVGSISKLLTRGQMAEIIYRLRANVTTKSSKTSQQLEQVRVESSNTSVDDTALPVGDGHVSTTAKEGYIFSCQTSFNSMGGANGTTPWIHGLTWNRSEKPSVSGSKSWSNGQFSITTSGDMRVITGNDIPMNAITGTFPIQQSDPAYQYDRNPNSIQTQTISLSLPLNPTVAANPTCVPMGLIGVAINGVAIFNGLDAEGRDAAAHEILDACEGHPQQQGMYHYHDESPCLHDTNTAGQSPLLGYALDGFGIYGKYDENGNALSSADLDECHGRTSPVMWDGKLVTMYHYVLTDDYPYTVGCFKGTPVSTGGLGNDVNGGNQQTGTQGGMQQEGQQGPGGTPPQAAIDACTGKASNASCDVNGHTGTCRTTPDGSFACVPG
ncbi:MAG TPA: S-layer homology domain-containing protein [Candidatus Peribacteraceae bacterium]|nr:S-layer homology domain-containing protein [Candidatus Peribacteraceae bacterium]